jgi:putative ABC transport system permease protein
VAGLLRFLRRRRRSDADFSAEIAAHLELEAERLVAEGFSPADAAAEARRRFGNVGQAQEAFHRRRTIGWIDACSGQLRRAARRLARAPVFSITTVLTLSLGIGATTAVFSLVEGVLLRPLPFAHPGALVDLSHTLQLQGASRVDQSDATYLYYRRANHVFTDVGAYRTLTVNFSDSGAGERTRAERLEAARASASLFALLGVAPLHGRTFRAAEDLGHIPVVLVGERLWRDRFGADPRIIGRHLVVDGVQTEVVGVVPARFAFPDADAALWLPIGIDPARTRSAAFDFRAVAALRSGVTPDAAAADLQALLPHVPEAFPGRLTAGAIAVTHMRAVVRPLRDVMVGGVERALWVVLGAGVFLLLVACGNVANLFLVRAEVRQHDLAVRRVLGAGHGAIVAEFLAEGLLLAATGGALGLALAGGGLHVLRSMPSAIVIPRLDAVGLDGTVQAVATGVTLLTALVMSVVPALRAFAGGRSLASVLAGAGHRATAGRSRHRVRRALVVVQLALALVLVAGAGLMARSFRALRAVPPGFDAARVSAFRVSLSDATFPTAAATVEFVDRALDGLAALPGVQAVGVVAKLPLEDEARRDTAVFVADRPAAMGRMPNIHQVDYATPGGFAALGIPFVEGRTFAQGDVLARPDASRAPLEVVVTRALARRYWGDEPAAGRRLRFAPTGPWFTVVGVTADIRGTRLDQPPDETVFLPFVTAPGDAAAGGGAGPTRWAPHGLAFVVRSTAAPRDVFAPVERVLHVLAPTIAVYDVHPMREVLARSTARAAFTLGLLELASLVALLIGAVGLYGVVSYMVSLRTREMAVRMALGARGAAVQRLVLAQAVVVSGCGIVVGLAASLALTPFLRAMLFAVAPTDPSTLLGAAAVMALVALVASWIPARRAATIDPVAALRMDG